MEDQKSQKLSEETTSKKQILYYYKSLVKLA